MHVERVLISACIRACCQCMQTRREIRHNFLVLSSDVCWCGVGALCMWCHADNWHCAVEQNLLKLLFLQYCCCTMPAV